MLPPCLFVIAQFYNKFKAKKYLQKLPSAEQIL